MPHWCVFVFGLVGLSWQVEGEINKYENHTLMRIMPQTDAELRVVSTFEDPMGEVEMLKSSRGMNDSMDVLVPPARMNFMNEFLERAKLAYEIKEKNYGRKLESPDRTPRRRVMGSSGLNVFAYNSYLQKRDIYHDFDLGTQWHCSCKRQDQEEELKMFAIDFSKQIKNIYQDYIAREAAKHPDLVTLQYLGDSYEGRRMSLVKISTNPSAGNPIIFIDAGIHAREWVAPAAIMYLIQRLINDPEAKNNELNGVDWYFLPVVNPDGFEFSRADSDNRMWRKTRSRNGNCFGVDGNRNYGFKWAVSGVSHNPCDRETYAGPEPFSEPETRKVRNVMMQYAKRIKLYVSLHSYGQYLVYPWGYTEQALPKDWRKLDFLARRVSDAVQRAGGKPFKVLSAGKWYPAAGGSDDYAFGAIGVPYSYTMELTDGYEFIFPERLLRQVLPQFHAGFKEFGAQIRKEFGQKRKHGHRSSRERFTRMITDRLIEE